MKEFSCALECGRQGFFLNNTLDDYDKFTFYHDKTMPEYIKEYLINRYKNVNFIEINFLETNSRIDFNGHKLNDKWPTYDDIINPKYHYYITKKNLENIINGSSDLHNNYFVVDNNEFNEYELNSIKLKTNNEIIFVDKLEPLPYFTFG